MSIVAQLSQPFRLRTFLGLALPMIVSRAGLAVMAIADGVMVSRYSPVEFAWLSLAEGTLGRVLDVFVAFLIGGLLLASRAFAQGDRRSAYLVWRRTVPVAVGLGLIGMLAGIYGRPLLILLGQGPALASGAAPVMALLGAGYPGALLAIAAAVYLEAIQRPRVVAVCVIVANVLNLTFNWLLIGGHLGFHAMGAQGSALSTTIMRYVLGLVLAMLAWSTRPPRRDSALLKAGECLPAEHSSNRAQWRLSLGAAVSISAMIALSSSLILFAGRMGALSLAVFSGAWGLAGPVALIAMGMADASGISVAQADGRTGLREAGAYAWSCLQSTLGVVGALALVLGLSARICAAVYAKEQALQQAIAVAVPVVAIVVVTDSFGQIMASSLRAIRDALWPPILEISALVLLVPLAWGLAFRAGFGVRGLFLAMLGASTARACMLTVRFFRCTRDGETQKSVPGPDALTVDTATESLWQKI